MGVGAVNIDVGQAFGFIGKIVDKIFPDKTEAERAKAELIKLQMSGDIEEIKQALAVFVNESSSTDKWTSRARPSFLYVMYIFILFSIPMGILSIFSKESAFQIAEGMKAWLSAIPNYLWGVFGTSFAVYTLARSYDKKQQME